MGDKNPLQNINKKVVKKYPWKGQRQGYLDGLNYMAGRMSGKLQSFATPWNKVNDAGVDGFEWHSMIVIGGRPGCLSGDSKLYISRKQKGSGRWYTLKELYEKFNGIHPIKWDLNKPTFMNSFKYDEDLTGLNLITGVFDSGKKDTWLVKTKSGKSIKATAKHPFLTHKNKIFKKLKHLQVGDFVYVRGVKSKVKSKRPYRKELGGKFIYYPNAGNRIVNNKIYYRVLEQRASFDAFINGLSLKDFLKEVSINPEHKLLMSDSTKEIHHIDGNPLNNKPQNLQLLSKSEHAKLHDKSNRKNLKCNDIILDEILSIDYVGKEQTYDVAMLSPYNNFIADGFVVHNTGKTLIKDQIVREAFELNKGSNMRILEFQFEMLARVSAIREYSSVLGQSYKYVCSAGGHKMTNADIKKCHEYAKIRSKNPVDIIEKPCSVEEFKKTVRQYMEAHATTVPINVTDSEDNITKQNKKQYMNTVISADHSYLFKKGKGNKTDMLYDLGEACTELKREYPIIFIILSQLKREADKPERNEDGKYGNYILDSDILGGDALMQHADLVFGLNRPGAKFIKFYGPERFIIENDKVLVFHFLKVRNGDTRMSFFEAQYEKMSIVEIPTPPTQGNKLSTQS